MNGSTIVARRDREPGMEPRVAPDARTAVLAEADAVVVSAGPFRAMAAHRPVT